MAKKYQVEVLDRRSPYQCSVFRVEEARIRMEGREFDRITVRHPGAAVIVPQAGDGRLILLEQYRHSIGETLLEFPAGTLEPGEDPADCAKREIVEETGFAAEEWISLGTLYPAPGFCDEYQHGFLARNLALAQAEQDDDEFITVREMTVAEVEEAVRQNRLRDGKSLGFFLRARLFGCF